MADNPYKSKRQTGYGATKPSNTGYGPYTPEHPSVVPITPPVKKAQLPNALEVCEKIQADYMTKLDLIYEAMPTTANRINRDNYAKELQQSCEEKARGMGYFDPINDIRDFLFGGDDQALIPNHGDKDEHGNTPRPTPDGQPIQPLPGPFKA
tara:strand:- start:326 stop:781 length:456 start_codon:yes stop_codon:yes gene_type:complete